MQNPRFRDSRQAQRAVRGDWLIPNTKVRYSSRNSAFEGACGAKCLGTRTMCPDGTVADIVIPVCIYKFSNKAC